MTRILLILNVVCVMALSPLTVNAEFLDLATMPLQTSGSSDVKPNLMFILDDSGSMGNTYTPDWATTNYNMLFDNSFYNTQSYNPNVTYVPAVTANNVSMGSQTNFTAVKVDVTDTGAAKGGTVNLTANADYFAFIAGEYCTTAALTSCQKSTQQTTSNTFPAEVRWCNSSAEAKAATPSSSMTCQGINDQSTYKYLRQPRAAYTLKITGVSGQVNVDSIKINNIELLSGTVSASSNTGLANAIVQSASNSIKGLCDSANSSALTATSTVRVYGNCQAGQTIVSSNSSGVIKFSTIVGAPINQSTPVQITYRGTASIVGTWDKSNADVPGSMVYVKITDSLDKYTAPGSVEKNPERTDCKGSTCTYLEEMANYANWYTYYKTRLQAMKTAASLAFSNMDSRYRIGFMRICDPGNSSTFLTVAPFDSTQKSTWYNRLYAASDVCGYTPIRVALSQAGRYFAGEKKLNSVDPMQYACQSNFTLLTTDGYWNEDSWTGKPTPKRISGVVDIGNLDGGATPKPQFDSSNAANTLADTAKYFYDTDIRDAALSNCNGALGTSVCGTTNDYTKQNMVTLTLGLGIDGTLVYTDDYKNQSVGDYNDLKVGNKNWPNPLPTANGTRIDDLWHAAVNAGGTYYSAKNPKLLRESLAKGLSEIKAVQGASAAAAASSLAPTTGDNFQYVASYQTVKWIGNLEARTVDVKSLETSGNAVWCVENVTATACPASTEETRITGNGSTSIYCKSKNSDQTTCDKAGGILGAVLGTNETSSCYVEVAGSCKGRLQTQVANGTRKILFNSGNSLVSFTAGSLSADQRDALSNGYITLSQMKGLLSTDTKITDPDKVGKLVDYLRGNKTYEDTSLNTVPANRLFRERQATLGDISQSRPNYFKASNAGYLDSNYKTFKDSTSSRTAAVYVGANDGMLHAFNANTGDELWAFIPTPVIANLANLADKEYGSSYHTNYVNGSPEVTDICVAGCSGSSAVWRTILVSGLNGGGRGYFAIDVTVPESPVLLWEFYAQSSGANSNLGYTFGNPVVTKMQDGRWVVLLTSGYNNGAYASKRNDGTFLNNAPKGDGRGYLYVLDAYTGKEVKTPLSTGEGTETEPSGLAKVSAYAEQMFENNTALNVYAGDLNGNIWRFNINTSAVTKIATLKDANGVVQKITTQPELGKVDKNIVVMVGTGKFLEPADLTNTPQNSVYTFKDNGQTTAIGRGQLIMQTLDSDRKVTLNKTAVNFDSGYGWFLDFPPGERVNLDPLLLNGVILMPTLVPSSQACSGAGYGWFNYFDYKKGGSVLASGIVSEMMTTPAVGYNIVYDDKGVPHVVVTGSNDPTPQQLSMDDQVFGLSGAGTINEIFKQKTNGSYGTKQSWHELIQ